MPRDFRPGMQGRIPLSFKTSRNRSALAGSLEPVALAGSITPVRDHPLGSRQTAQQGRGSGVVADLPCGYEELKGPSLGVCDCVQLGVQATLRSANQTPALIAWPPFFVRRLEAVRCALRYVGSIMMVFCSVPSEAGPSIIRAKTPMLPHRFQRL